MARTKKAVKEDSPTHRVARDVRTLCRTGHPHPLQPGRRAQARVRPHQGHRDLRRHPARSGHALRSAEPAREPGAHRGGAERGPQAAVQADGDRGRRPARPPRRATPDRRSGPPSARRQLGHGMSAATPAERHAARLLRCYPRAWRERYGEEFAALLMEEWAERPRSPRRSADVMASGLVARLSGAGLTGGMLDGPAQARASLAALDLCGGRLLGPGCLHVGTAHHRLAVVRSRHHRDGHRRCRHDGAWWSCSPPWPRARRLRSSGPCCAPSATGRRRDSGGRWS